MKPLHFTTKGHGFPLVFIHGFCESTQIWDTFVNDFQSTYQVVCLDLPGHGESPGLGYETTIEKMAFQVKETLEALDLSKIILIGHSLGGYVSLAFAEMFPESVSGLCLFHSSAFEDTPEKKENRNKTIEYVEKHGVDAFSIPFVPGLFYHKRREALKDEIDFATQIARKMAQENVVNTIRAMRDRKERTRLLEQLQVPFAFIIGKEDTAVPLNKSLEQCHLPSQSHVLFLSDTGHMGMLERKKECVSFLWGFFRALSD